MRAIQLFVFFSLSKQSSSTFLRPRDKFLYYKIIDRVCDREAFVHHYK